MSILDQSNTVALYNNYLELVNAKSQLVAVTQRISALNDALQNNKDFASMLSDDDKAELDKNMSVVTSIVQLIPEAAAVAQPVLANPVLDSPAPPDVSVNQPSLISP